MDNFHWIDHYSESVYKLQCLLQCLSVHVWKPLFPVDCTLLVKERIANIGIPLDISCFCHINNFFWFFTFYCFFGLANQPTVHIGGLALGGLWVLALVIGDMWHGTRNTRHVTCGMWHMTHDTWHVTHDIFFFFFLSVRFCLFWYWFYYPRTLR